MDGFLKKSVFLFPSVRIPSTYLVDYRKLADMGFKAVLFDVDNTLVPHGAPADERARKMFEDLTSIGFKTALVSNNKEPRVKAFADEVGCAYVYLAHKPSAVGYRKSMEVLGVTPDETIAVGDQLFTDIWGANNAGIVSVLTAPIHPKEEIQIILKRIAEKPFVWFYSFFLEKKNVKPGDAKSIQIPPVDGKQVSPYGDYNGRSGSLKSMQD